jgi:hypothetical protein
MSVTKLRSAHVRGIPCNIGVFKLGTYVGEITGDASADRDCHSFITEGRHNPTVAGEHYSCR